MADYGGGCGPSSSSPQISLTPQPRTTEPHTSDSDANHTTTPNPTPKTDLSIVITPLTSTDLTVTPPSSSTGKKPRGRPPGSKNKPKPPTIVTQKDESAMHVTVLEVKSGTNIVDAVHDFARRRRVGVSIIAGSGAVSSLVLRHSHTTSSSTYSLHGRFDIVNLSATILPTSSSTSSSSPSSSSMVGVTVAGPQGMVYGGTVVGELMAAGTVVLVAGTFGKSEFQRLAMSDTGEEQNINHDDHDDGNIDESDGAEEVKPVTISTTQVGGGMAYGNNNTNNSNNASFLFPWGHHTSSSSAAAAAAAASGVNHSPPLHLHPQQRRF